MATLESIGTTLGIGTVVLVVSVGLFGCAVQKRSILIAPRATARPRNVIYNPHPAHTSQDRGSSYLGWIPWTLQLSYETMLQGVPGTGTRQNGLSGLNLKVNLDGIVLLKFHAFARRISLVASLLYILFLLPVYYTARCHNPDDWTNATVCSNDSYNLTNYERTTIMNVPSANLKDLTQGQRSRSLARLYAASFVYLFLVLYVLYYLDKIYVQLLAMRRVYYLEHDIWDERRQELKQTLLYEECSKEIKQRQQHFTFEEHDQQRHAQQHKQQQQVQDDDDDDDEDRQVRFSSNPQEVVLPPAEQQEEELDEHMVIRDPWIPHPEQRETVPNISLYSVLVGGLPSIPETLLNKETDLVDDEFGKQRTNMDWQLEMATQIFDLCVPNQPGYSSSVAAVTIIPGAHDMTAAWRKWYTAASKMRRLDYIRKEIARRRAYDIVIDDDDDDDVETPPMPAAKKNELEGDNDEEFHSTSLLVEQPGADPKHTHLSPQVDPGQPTAEKKDVITPRPIYRGLSKRMSYFKQVFGSTMQLELEKDVTQAIALGPEQSAVYSRELAQSAAPCCPFGCRQDRIDRARIDDLIEMEKEAAEELHAANVALNEIRRKVTVTIDLEESGIKRSSHGNKTTLSFEDGEIPADFGLEAQLYKRNSKQNTNNTSNNNINSNSKSKLSFADAAAAVMSDNRASPFRSALKPRSADSNLWQHVEAIVNEAKHTESRNRAKSLDVSIATSDRSSSIETGEWHLPSWKRFKGRLEQVWWTIREWTTSRSTGAVDAFARESTYAVVTFTSRQAAVAARRCLADGRGQERWQAMSEIPIPPLADAAACDIMACRNCFRPVTISINNRQKNGRKYLAIALLGCIYVFYTVPLTVAANVANAGTLTQVAPKVAEWVNSMGLSISGIVSSALYSLFFSLCPTMFKAIANFGSGAVSVAQAEFFALQYYWWFMVLTAFSSTLLATMVIDAFNEGLTFGSEFRYVLAQISATVPGTISVTWLNWIIFRFSITLPLNYLLQLNSFIFSALGWKCCTRMMMGGGPGGPTPYRIYVDSGVVLMCILALAPASPLVSLAGFVYFVIIEPLLRRNLIFVYRPKHDGGGIRWLFIFEMVISTIIVGVIFLTAQMILKAAIGPAIVAALPIVPTAVYRWHAKAKYKRAFDDAALLQTALLDGWDTAAPTSQEQREEFRKWLLDAHKAAYVPVCLFGLDTVGCLTAEPAVVIPMESDPESTQDIQTDATPSANSTPGQQLNQYKNTKQLGATFRRSVNTVALFRRTLPLASENAPLVNDHRFASSAPSAFPTAIKED